MRYASDSLKAMLMADPRNTKNGQLSESAAKVLRDMSFGMGPTNARGMPIENDAEMAEWATKAAARARLSGPMGYETGSKEDLIATAETPADRERISMDADGNYYRSKRQPGQEAANAAGMGHLVIQPTYHGSGPKEREERMGMLSKHGVEMGDFWQDVKNINRGRSATGFGQEHIPGSDLMAAGQRGAAQQQSLNARAVSPNVPLAVETTQNQLQLSQQMDDPEFGNMDVGRAKYNAGAQRRRPSASLASQYTGRGGF